MAYSTLMETFFESLPTEKYNGKKYWAEKVGWDCCTL